MTDHADWTPVTWTKPPAKPKMSTKQTDGGEGMRRHRIAEATGDDGFEHATVSKSFSAELQRARLSKKVTQKALAQLINVKPRVVNDYESGKALPNQAVIAKLNRALGVQLPSATKQIPTQKKVGVKL